MGWKIMSFVSLGLAALAVGLVLIGYENQLPKRADSSVPAAPPTQPATKPSAGAVTSDQADDSHNPADPALARLPHLRAKLDLEHKSRYFTALAAVLQQNGIELKDFEPNSFIDEGSAVSIDADPKGQVMAILGGWDHSVSPGAAIQVLLLFDASGKIQDRLTCAASDGDAPGFAPKPTFRTEMVYAPGQQDPLFAVRLVPPSGEPLAENGSHKIVYHGKSYSFPWQQTKTTGIPKEDFESKGLCRVAIHAGRFVAVFPDLTTSAE